MFTEVRSDAGDLTVCRFHRARALLCCHGYRRACYHALDGQPSPQALLQGREDHVVVAIATEVVTVGHGHLTGVLASHRSSHHGRYNAPSIQLSPLGDA